MFENMTPYGCRTELSIAFDLVARTGFITKAGIGYVADAKGASGIYRFIEAMNRSGMFAHSSKCSKFPTWTLSSLGLRMAQAMGFRPPEHPDEQSVFHDAMVSNLALEFRRRGLVEAWASQHELRRYGSERVLVEETSAGRKYPDLLMRTPNPMSAQIAIELELTRDRYPRYERLLQGYMNTTGIELLLVVYLDDRLPGLIDKLARDLNFPMDRLPIVFADLRDLFRDYESGHERSQPDHKYFGLIINRIRSELAKRDSLSTFNYLFGGNRGTRRRRAG